MIEPLIRPATADDAPRLAALIRQLGYAVSAAEVAERLRTMEDEGRLVLVAELEGKPLVRIAVEQALASRAESVVVVTGHQHDRVEQALQGLDVRFVHNPDYADGLATSLKTGINAVPASSGAAIVCLGDMPLVGSGLIDRLIEAYAPERDGLITIPVADGRRGNPVLWSRKLFKELLALEGDIGARHVIQKYAEMVVEVPATGVSAFLDVDTPDVLARLLTKR